MCDILDDLTEVCTEPMITALKTLVSRINTVLNAQVSVPKIEALPKKVKRIISTEGRARMSENAKKTQEIMRIRKEMLENAKFQGEW